MPIPITVPRLGWSMDKGTFVGWLKNDGASVKAGEPLFTLDGDKATQEIEATHSGILRIPADAPKAGDVVAVGALLGYLAGENEREPLAGGTSDGEAAAGSSGAPEGPGVQLTAELREPEVRPPAVPVSNGLRPKGAALAISPRARRRAAALGLDYHGLKGSGRTGRIIEADIVAAARQVAPAGGAMMRRTIARRTADSFLTAPHCYLRTEVDIEALIALRERLVPDVEKATGIRLTLTDLLLRAQAQALCDCPWANALWQDDHAVRAPGCDVGLVVGVEQGVLIPIVRGAHTCDWNDLVRQRASLVEAARAGQLTSEAVQGGATSLSNLGNTCVDEFFAVIAPPQSSMLAVGRAVPRPFVVDGRLVVRTTLKLSLSVDHRVVDGVLAARFLGCIAALLKHPAGWAS
jgi:pyruvate dehydrogenase E2 component (dihydrolipoamide acetyltransferase)